MGTQRIRRGRTRLIGAVAAGLVTVAMLGLGATVPVAAGAATSASAAAWTPSTASVPTSSATGATSYSSITNATCASPGYCVAVGYFRTSAGNTTYLPLVQIYSGGSWSQATVPLPTGAGTGTAAYAYLEGVSCTAPGTCVATGAYEAPTTGTMPLVETLSSGTWTATTAPLPAGAGTGTDQYSYLEGVSCPAAGNCTAVGTYESAAGRVVALVETLSSGTWTPSTAPLPSSAGTGTDQYSYLEGVSCPGVGTCTATGSYENATGNTSALIETLSSGTWTASTGPLPAEAGTGTDQYSYLEGVSCPAAGNCIAGGAYENSTGVDTAFFETLSSGTWTASTAPLPAGAANKYSYVDGVSCAAGGTCTAVGGYENSTSEDVALVESLSSGTWTPSTAPSPAGAGTGTKQFSGLYGVACVAGGCVAGGAYKNTTGGYQGFLETHSMAPSGYFEAASDGGIFAFTVPFYGSMGGKPLNQPIVSSAADTLTGGYYEVASDGGIFAFNAPFLGSMGGKPLNAPIVGMAFDTRTGGYYEVASDGGIFAFTAPFYGSMGGKPLNQPIVGMAFDPSTGGYWEVASDGGLFSFTAPFQGSMGGKPLNKPIVGMAFDSLTGGYYEVASDGGLFAFNAPFEGSMGGKPLNLPVVGMAFDYGTGGYWEVASDGGLFAFNAPFLGSMGGKPLNKPVVTMSIG